MAIVLAPIKFLFKTVTLVVTLLGRLITIVVGAVLVIVGGVLTLTIILSIAGIPLISLGFTLITAALS